MPCSIKFVVSSEIFHISHNKRSRALRARAREDMLIRFKLMVPNVPCSIKFVVSSEIFDISQDLTFYIKIDIFHIRKNAVFLKTETRNLRFSKTNVAQDTSRTNPDVCDKIKKNLNMINKERIEWACR